MAMQGHAWIASLTLPDHADILGRLVGEIEADTRFRFIEVDCSIARGTADRLSDLDLALGIADDSWPDALGAVPALLGRLGPLVDLLEHQLVEWGERPHRRFFAQYENGVQIDLVALPVSQRPGLPVGSLALYDADGHLATTVIPRAAQASAADVREWAFLAWIALADLDKYVRRGSPWEAFERLQQARTFLWRLWAVAQGLEYPVFGLTSVLDAPVLAVPDGVEETVATLDPGALRAAAVHLARLLGPVSAEAASATRAALPDGMARFVRARLVATTRG
ncbi:MAG: hypothetical protein ACYDCI_10445 [Candidatus Limnocylindrales bacterium]